MIYILFFLCYAIGSIPFGWLIGKIFFKIDIRDYGSNNIGATNVWRVLGWRLGLAVFFLDFFKGLAIIWLVPFIITGEPSNLIWTLAGLAAISGHLYSIWFWFKGGKGVATSAGVLAVLLPVELVVAFIVFIIIVAIFRYISLGSLLAVVAVLVSYFIITSQWLSSPKALFTNEQLPLTLFIIFISVVVVYAHRKNIVRLIRGEENKFNFSSFI